MSINIINNYNLNASIFLDNRKSIENLNTLKSVSESGEILYPYGFEVFCVEEGAYFVNVAIEGIPEWEQRMAIEDEMISLTTTYSSQKISQLLQSVATIQDDVISSTTTYSSQKIIEIIRSNMNGGSGGTGIGANINDEQQSATTTYSSQKVESIFAELRQETTRVDDDLLDIDTRVEYLEGEMWKLYGFDGSYDSLTNKPSLENYATKEYVDETVANIQINGGSGGSVDLGDYATKEYVDNEILPINNSVEYIKEMTGVNQFNVVNGTLSNITTFATNKANGDSSTKRYINANVNITKTAYGTNAMFVIKNNQGQYCNNFSFNVLPHSDLYNVDNQRCLWTINSVECCNGAKIQVKIYSGKQFDSNFALIDSAEGYCCIEITIASTATTEQIAMLDTATFIVDIIDYNYLALDGKLEYTPTADYHPATKKYVDDNMPIKILPYVEGINNNTQETVLYSDIDVSTLEGNCIYMTCPNNYRLRLRVATQSGTFINIYMSYYPNNLQILVGTKTDELIELIIKDKVYVVHFATETEEYRLETTPYFLANNNTTAYTPTGDYNPATKKYVDEAVTNSNSGSGDVDLSDYATIEYVDDTKDFLYTEMSECQNNFRYTTLNLGTITLNEFFGEANVGNTESAGRIYYNLDKDISAYNTGSRVDMTLLDTDDKIISYSIANTKHDVNINPILQNVTLPSGTVFTAQVMLRKNIQYDESFNQVSAEGKCCLMITFPKASNTEAITTEFKTLKLELSLYRYNFLTLTNKNEFVPAEDYHPATKKYVDEAVANIQPSGGGGDLSSYAPIDNPSFTNSISMGRTGEVGNNSTALGNNVEASGLYSHAEGQNTIASGLYSHAEGDSTTASGESSHAEGFNTTASECDSHAEGYYTIASGYDSHAEGYYTTASGEGSHAEGSETTASGNYSHAEGDSTTASGLNSHAEGESTTASGLNSHAEGYGCDAKGECSHAEGMYSVAEGNYSHAEGHSTAVYTDYAHVQGKYNKKDREGIYAHIVGNGTYDDSRSNAHTLDWDGNAWYAGQVIGTNLPWSNLEIGELIIEQTVLMEAQSDGTGVGYTSDVPITFVEGEKICFTFNGEQYICETRRIDNYSIHIGNGTLSGYDEIHNNEPFAVNFNRYGEKYIVRIYVAEKYVGIEIPIKIEKATGELHKLDEIYLPNTVATKEYVDDSIANVGNEGNGLPLLSSICKKNEDGSLYKQGAYYCLDFDLIPKDVTKTYYDDISTSLGVLYSCYLSLYKDESLLSTAWLSLRSVYPLVSVGYRTVNQLLSLTNSFQNVTYDLGTNTRTLEETYSITSKAPTSSVLTKTNTTEYTPTTDYHPATKKYVDDNSLIEDYGDTIIAEIPIDTIWEGYEQAKVATEEHGFSEIYITLPHFELVADGCYQMEFLGKIMPIGDQDNYLYSSDIWTEDGGYYVPGGDNEWVDDETKTALVISWDFYSHLTKEQLTPFIIRKINVKPIEGKYLDFDFKVGHSLSMGRHAMSEVGLYSTALGEDTRATAINSHAEGDCTEASGEDSHAEGAYSVASGKRSHAEGFACESSGEDSHAEGNHTIAEGYCQHVQGRYNIIDEENKYAHIVGNGTNYSNRKNAHTIDWDGNGWFAGNVSVDGTPTADNDLVTKKYVDDAVANLSELKMNIVNGLTFANAYINYNNGDYISGGSAYACQEYIPVISGATYEVSGVSNIVRIAYYDSSKAYINQYVDNTPTFSFTSPSNASYIRVHVDSTSNAWQNLSIESEIENYIRAYINNATSGGSGNVDLSLYALKTDLHSHSNKTVIDTITSNMITKWNQAISFNDTYASDCNAWLTNGYIKTGAGQTSNLPSACTGSDRWGILFFIAENEAQGTGTQMYFPIDGTYKGRIFTRSLTNMKASGSNAGEWNLVSVSNVGASSLANESTMPTISDVGASTNEGYVDGLLARMETLEEKIKVLEERIRTLEEGE